MYIYLTTAGCELYESVGVHIQGITDPGRLIIYDISSYLLSSYITIRGCFSHILFQNLNLRESRPLNGGNQKTTSSNARWTAMWN